MIRKFILNKIPVKFKVWVLNFIPNIKKLGLTIVGRLNGISIVKPDSKLPNLYIYKNRFSPGDTIVDVGCGYDADFSFYMIKLRGVHAIGIDPTLKHQKSLAELSEKSDKKFSHQMWAVSNFAGKIKFNESVASVSGSIMKEHINIKDKKNGRIRS
jgi:hypothetical protein